MTKCRLHVIRCLRLKNRGDERERDRLAAGCELSDAFVCYLWASIENR